MDIRKIKKSDIPAVSALHRRTLPGATARIGNPYLSDLYNRLLCDTSLHTALAATKNSQIIGVITATSDLHSTNHQLQTVPFDPRVLWSIGVAVLERRVTIMELIRRVTFERELHRQFPAPYATILTFFVDKKYQHQGIGKQLLLTLQHQLPKPSKLHVDTEVSNTSAQGWYTAHGFRVLKTINNNVVSVKTLIPAET